MHCIGESGWVQMQVAQTHLSSWPGCQVHVGQVEKRKPDEIFFIFFAKCKLVSSFQVGLQVEKRKPDENQIYVYLHELVPNCMLTIDQLEENETNWKPDIFYLHDLAAHAQCEPGQFEIEKTETRLIFMALLLSWVFVVARIKVLSGVHRELNLRTSS